MENGLEKQLVTAFMAVVTCYLLTVVFTAAGDGTNGLAEVVVFGFGAAFGLEYLWSAWAPETEGSMG